VAHWRSGKLRPLCVFNSARMPYKEKVTETMSWSDIPTCKESGINMDYLMLRGIFMPAKVSPDAVAFYVALMNKVRETPEWKAFMERGAFDQSSMSGEQYRNWVAQAEKLHLTLMKEAGFLAKK